jgi:chromodomain-helicase-DNA-binding protein 1
MLIFISREFLSSIWPLGDVKVSGKRLQRMFGDLMERDRKARQKEEEERRAAEEERRANELRRAKHPDLEDGEIPSDREELRRPAVRDAYRDDRREERREERRSSGFIDDRRDDRSREELKRRNYYDDDRLNFYRHRRPDNRNVPVRHSSSSWQSRSPPARQSPY